MTINQYVLIPLATWAVAQTLKFAIAALSGRIDFKYLYASGGMPSVHSAVVTALSVTAAAREGTDSPLFGVTVIFATIVMYDSFGVRRASGEQAAAINMLIGSLDRDHVRLQQPSLRLREILGHKPLEVLVGAVIGALIAALFNAESLAPQLDFLKTAPGQLEFSIYLGLFGALVLGGWLARFLLLRRYRNSRAVRRFSKSLLIKTQTIGGLGLITSLTEFEKVSYLAWRLWPILLLLALLTWDAYLIDRYGRSLPEAIAEERSDQDRRRWLPTTRKKRRPTG